jgi:hypothetical protein
LILARPPFTEARKAFGSKAISFGFLAITDPLAARHGRNMPMLVTPVHIGLRAALPSAAPTPTGYDAQNRIVVGQDARR